MIKNNKKNKTTEICKKDPHKTARYLQLLYLKYRSQLISSIEQLLLNLEKAYH